MRSLPSFQGSATLNHRPTPWGRQKLFLPLSQPYTGPSIQYFVSKVAGSGIQQSSTVESGHSLGLPQSRGFSPYLTFCQGSLVLSKCPVLKPWARPPVEHPHSMLSAAGCQLGLPEASLCFLISGCSWDLCAGTFCFSIPSMLLFLFSFPSVFPPLIPFFFP